MKSRMSEKLSGKLPCLFNLFYQVTKFDQRDFAPWHRLAYTVGIKFTDGLILPMDINIGGATAPVSHLGTPLGPLVFRGGYHARVWSLKKDPKLGFWVDLKTSLNRDFDKFSTP